MKNVFYILAAALAFASCRQQQPAGTQISPKMPPPRYATIKTTYRMLATEDSIRSIAKVRTNDEQRIIMAVNRADLANLTRMDSIIVPDNLQGNIQQYSPFPQQVSALQQVSKIVFFSYPAQYFGAYEHGQLVYSGPTNMGREKDKTPTGLFYTNWKAEETRSTFNDEWELKWNFNIENKEGVGWHQYAMPGYPASHSCLRLLEEDARYLFTWADAWKLKGDDIVAYGTPVIVFGSYPFGSTKPWLQLTVNPDALAISAQQLESEVRPHMNDIIDKQAAKENNKAQ